MKEWQEKTCLRFEPYGSAGAKKSGHNHKIDIFNGGGKLCIHFKFLTMPESRGWHTLRLYHRCIILETALDSTDFYQQKKPRPWLSRPSSYHPILCSEITYLHIYNHTWYIFVLLDILCILNDIGLSNPILMRYATKLIVLSGKLFVFQ